MVIGIVSPLLFVPRWPIAFVSGMLYGVIWGSVLANVASTLGAILHFWLAKTLLSPMSARLCNKYNIHPGKIPQEKQFATMFFLRAFPLSSFVLTNLFAGALNMRMSTFIWSSFLGMIPSTLMYAAWGKLMKKPSTEFYILAVAILVLLMIGTWIAQRKFMPWFSKLSAGTDGRDN